MRQRSYLILLFLFITCSVSAQLYNPLNPTGVGSNYQGRYDYEQFLLQQKQSDLLIKPDTLGDVRTSVETTPEELRKLGVQEEFVEEIMRLNAMQDSLTYLGYMVQKEQNSDNDTITVEYLQNVIEFQKQEIMRKMLALPVAEIYGQEFFRNNVVNLFDKQIINSKPTENYVLATGDEINITVWGKNDVSEQFVIDDQGSIVPDIVGKIYLKGLTFKRAKELVLSKYKEVYGSQNEVEIALNFNRLIGVNIVGEVFNPGTYSFSSMNSAFNALVAVDGPNQLGTVRSIKIKRGGSTVKTLDVYKYLTNPDGTQDFFLETNDYIFVPPQGEIVSIAGAIKRPKKYEILPNESISDLIKYAGGLEKNAHKGAVGIRRYINNSEEYFELSLDSLNATQSQFLLQNGDSIFIKSIQSLRKNFVVLDGAFKVPGSYILKNNDKVADVIFRAGGPTQDAALNKGFLFRTNRNITREIKTFKVSEILVDQSNLENVLLEPNDTIFLLSMDSIRQEFPVYVNGEVKNPGIYKYGQNLTLQDLMLLSGNFRREAAGGQLEVSRILEFSKEDPKKGERIIVKRSDISKALMIPATDQEFVLEPYDRIVIRRSTNFELQQSVYLMGEVKYPGEYSLINKGEDVYSLISRAGGFTDYAFKEAAELHRIIDGHIFMDLADVFKQPKSSKYNYILSHMDTVVVPKMRNYVSIEGAVKYFVVDSLPVKINVPFEVDKKANYYVNKYAGGFGRHGRKKETYVQHSNGEVQRVRDYWLFKVYPEVENGGTIFVDEKERLAFVEERLKKRKARKFDWNRALDSFASSVISVVTMILLLQQLRN